MTPERFQLVRSVFEDVSGLSSPQRDEQLQDLRLRDPELAVEVERLLYAHQHRGAFIETPALSPADDFTGRRIGPYLLLREAGRGGMGSVYEAVREDDAFHKRVAIKLVRATPVSEALGERFRRERQILAGLEHPNIARILDGGTTEEGLPFFVMEYADGERIDRYAERNRLGVEARLDLFLDVAGAVQFAHRNLIVHRDIKPANIIVTVEGQPKLLDFGIAKLLSDADTPGRGDAATEAMLCTPEYASPEQIRGEPVTTAADIYLLGLLLYELLAGRHPFAIDGRLPHETMRAACEDEPLRPSAAAAQAGVRWSRRLKGELDNIVLMALRKEPQRRYASVEQLAGDIRRYLDGRPVRAQGDAVTYRAAKFFRRHWAPAAALALTVVSLSGSAIVSAGAAARAGTERVEAQRQAAIAEAERRRAESEKALAREAAAEAAEQRAIAEGKTREAERERVRAERNLAAQRELALSITRLGDGQVRSGELKAAIANFEQTLAAQEAVMRDAPADLVSRKVLGVLQQRLCIATASAGDTITAMDTCRAAIGNLRPLLASRVDDTWLRNSLAVANATLGKLLLNARKPAEAVELSRAAVALLAGVAARDPADKRATLMLANTQTYLAQALFDTSRQDEALATYANAVSSARAMLKAQPPESGPALALAVALSTLAARLKKIGDVTRAEHAMEQALEMYRGLAERPGAGVLEFNEYANALVKCEFDRLRRAGIALEYARRAARASNESNPAVLDTLAWALYRNGEADQAAEMERKALALLPDNARKAPFGLGRELEQGLAEFESAIK